MCRDSGMVDVPWLWNWWCVVVVESWVYRGSGIVGVP